MSVMTTFQKIQRQKNRGGVSLLEILICVGILSIGLLGVAALIPAGHFAVVETTKADRSVACAKAAKAEVQVRGTLKPEDWYVWNGTNFFPIEDPGAAPGTDFRSIRPEARGSTVVIDPLAIANCKVDPSMNYTNIYQFPHKNPNIATGRLWRFTTRRSLYDAAGSNLPDNIALGLNERLYRWTDDAKFDVDDTDPDQRPRQVYTFNTGDFGPYPDTAAPGLPILSEFQGDYSYFFTVTPLNDGNTWDGTVNIPKPLAEIKSFEVSAVICYKRDWSFDATANIPEERLADVDDSFAGISGAGASDIPLRVPGVVSKTGVDSLEYLDVKPGQWIMLVGQTDDRNFNFKGSTVNGYRTVGKWYRILSVDDEMTGDIRWITVTGPEWRTPAVHGAHQPGEMYNTQAIIVDSVIGVFTETMTLDR